MPVPVFTVGCGLLFSVSGRFELVLLCNVFFARTKELNSLLTRV